MGFLWFLFFGVGGLVIFFKVIWFFLMDFVIFWCKRFESVGGLELLGFLVIVVFFSGGGNIL